MVPKHEQEQQNHAASCDHKYSGIQLPGAMLVSRDTNNYSEIKAAPVHEGYSTTNFSKSSKNKRNNCIREREYNTVDCFRERKGDYAPESYSSLEIPSTNEEYSSVDHPNKRKGRKGKRSIGAIIPPDPSTYSQIEPRQPVDHYETTSHKKSYSSLEIPSAEGDYNSVDHSNKRKGRKGRNVGAGIPPDPSTYSQIESRRPVEHYETTSHKKSAKKKGTLASSQNPMVSTGSTCSHLDPFTTNNKE